MTSANNADQLACLHTRWHELLAFAGSRGGGDQLFDELAAAYTGANRHYHDLAHIQHCLSELDRHRHLAGNPVAVELALWYHDAVLDTRASDNEERSAALAHAALTPIGLDRSLVDRVRDLVRATRHSGTTQTDDEALIADVDLAILGSGPEAFRAYEAAVRLEYSWVDEPVFWRRRAELLESFMARPFIFSTVELRDRFEAAARRNLAGSIQGAAARSGCGS